MGKRKEEEMKTSIAQITLILILMPISSMVIYANESQARESVKKEKISNRSLIENGEPNLPAIIKYIDDMYRSESSISLMTLIVIS